MTIKKMSIVLAEADLLVTEAEVGAAISRMAQEITDQLKDTNPILICVMNGGLIFTGQLLTKLGFLSLMRLSFADRRHRAPPRRRRSAATTGRPR